MKFKAKGQEFAKILDHKNNLFEDPGRRKTVVIGGDNLPFPVGIGLTNLPRIGEASGPPSSGIKLKKELGFRNPQEKLDITLATKSFCLIYMTFFSLLER